MNRTFSIISIVISLAALGLSLFTFTRPLPSSPNQEQIRLLIQTELDARDHARVVALAPKAKRIYQDMISPDHFDPNTFAPTTYEELFAPMMTVINQLTTQ